jgi:hypothetical protein
MTSAQLPGAERGRANADVEQRRRELRSRSRQKHSSLTGEYNPSHWAAEWLWRGLFRSRRRGTGSGSSLCNHIQSDADRSQRKLNTSPSTVEEKEYLKKPLCTPMIKKIDLHFPLGLEVTARNLKGVTIKDALDAIHKQFKKKVCYTSFPRIASRHSTVLSGKQSIYDAHRLTYILPGR